MIRRISSGKARKGITRSQARSQTARAAVRVLLFAHSVLSSSSTWRAASASAAESMDDAGLVHRLREDGVDRLREAGQPVGADEEHVLDAAVAQIGEHARPEAGALALLDPEAETVALALERDADSDVDGLLAHNLLVADRDLHRVQVHDDVQLLQRSALPGADVVLDRTGHLRDQPLGDLDAVQLAQVPLDVAGRHPAGVKSEDLLVEAIEGAALLGHDPRLERGVAVAGQLDRDRPVDRPQRLLRDAVAPIRLPLRRLRARRITEMLLQLDTGRTLDQPPPQPVDQPIRTGQPLRPLVLPEQLIDQLARDLHLAHHGPPSGPPAGIAPTPATPRSSRPRRTNQSDTQKSAHYPLGRQRLRRHPHQRLARSKQPPLQRACQLPAVLDRPQPFGSERSRPGDKLARAADGQLSERPSEPVDGNRRQRLLVHVHSDHDHRIASYRWGRPASGQTSLEAAATLRSGHARRSRAGGGDTTLASQPTGDVRESSQPPPTRVSCAHRTPPSAENDSEFGNVTLRSSRNSVRRPMPSDTARTVVMH